VEVGGVGLSVTVTSRALAAARIGEEASLATALVVREDAWTLFGFADAHERLLFDQLQTVTGVGPRMAVTAVSALGPAELVRAIGSGDVAALTLVPGVGKKTAERIVLELREKVGAIIPATPTVPVAAAGSTGAGAWQRQVLDGLVGLGWQQRDAEEAVRLVAADILAEGLDTTNVSGLLRRALGRLDRA
jgi:Holliday junction DNA helicase RuvA